MLVYVNYPCLLILTENNFARQRAPRVSKERKKKYFNDRNETIELVKSFLFTLFLKCFLSPSFYFEPHVSPCHSNRSVSQSRAYIPELFFFPRVVPRTLFCHYNSPRIRFHSIQTQKERAHSLAQT